MPDAHDVKQDPRNDEWDVRNGGQDKPSDALSNRPLVHLTDARDEEAQERSERVVRNCLDIYS